MVVLNLELRYGVRVMVFAIGVWGVPGEEWTPAPGIPYAELSGRPGAPRTPPAFSACAYLLKVFRNNSFAENGSKEFLAK